MAAIPKSVTPERIQANISIFDFTLSDEDLAEIATLANGTRYCVPMIKLVSIIHVLSYLCLL